MADNALYGKTGLLTGANAAANVVKKTNTTPGGGIPTNIPTTVLPDTPSTGTKINGGTSGGKKTTGTSSTSVSTPGMSDYLTTLAEQRKAQAQAAYDQGINKLNDIYGNQATNFANIYNNGVGQIEGSYNNSLGKINQQGEKAMQEAYVNRMLAEKNLSQKLAAQGLSGGASETTMAGLLNNYGNARNNIQTTMDSDLSDLEQQKLINMGQLYDAYQTNLANLATNKGNAELALLNNLNNQIGSVDDSLFEALLKNPTLLQNAAKDTVASMGSYVPSEQTVTNTNTAVNTQQKNDQGSVAQGGRLSQLEELMSEALRNRISSNPNINSDQASNWLAGLYGPGYLDEKANVFNYLNGLGYRF